MKRKQETGRSMVEMVGVLAVMGLITAGAFILITSGMESQRRNRASDEVGTIVAAIREQHSGYLTTGANNFTYYVGWDDKSDSIGTQYLSRLRINTKNPWSGDYSVRYSNDGNFFVVIKGLSKSDCDVLKQKAWSGALATPTCERSGSVYSLLIKYGFVPTN